MRKALALLHRWLGLSLGLWLLLVSASGSLLLYHDELLRWQYPQLAGAEWRPASHYGPLLDRLQAEGSGRYLRLPRPERPWLELVDGDDNRHYYDHQGRLLLTRPYRSDLLGWVQDWHLHLLAGLTGHELLGWGGLLVVVLIATGLYRWWPANGWRWQLLRIDRKGPIERRMRQWHSVSALLFAVPLLLVTLTGVAMVFSKQVQPLLAWLFADGSPPALQRELKSPMPIASSHWQQWLQQVEQHWPDGQLRLVYLRQEPTDAPTVRVQRAAEWHPNGRSFATFDGHQGQLLSAVAAADLGLGARISHSFYPLHVAAIGGEGYRLLLAITGLLPLLLTYTGWRYWLAVRRRRSGRGPQPAR